MLRERVADHARRVAQRIDRPALHEVKEPNVYPINLAAIEEDIIELLHETRKDGKILNAGLQKLLTSPARMLRLIPVLTTHFRNFDSDLKRFRMDDKYKFGMHLNNFSKGTSVLLGSSTSCTRTPTTWC